jgi:RNA polymerase sigma factor (sigma-70 family)
MPPRLDAKVVQLALSGHPDALQTLLQQAQPDIRRYARRYCLASDVDDAAQEALLALATKLPQLRAVAACSGWLMTTVRRECLRLARLVWRHDPLDEALDARVARQPALDLLHDLSRALESLPTAHREVLLCRDVEALSLAEIAQRTGESVACIKSRLHRARAMVREHLGTEEA